MTLKPHQTEAVAKAAPILKSKGLVYIFGQPRVGKSLIALELSKQCVPKQPGKTLVFTKKMAITDWLQYNESYDYEVTNYEKAEKLNPDDYNFIIIDEAHNFGAFPKPSQRIKTMRQFCKGKPIVFLSGTPFVESPNSAYSQLSLSSFSPFKEFKTPYDYFRRYGIPDQKWIYGRLVETYAKGRLPEVLDNYVIRVTYDDAGFKYQNYDDIHMIDCPEALLDTLDRVRRSGMYNESPLETESSAVMCLHRLCGGFYNGPATEQPKLDWLMGFVDLAKKSAIMCYFIEEQKELARLLPNCTVLSSTQYCEGIDLSGYDQFILYSFGYSGAKFIQLRDRIVNLNKDKKTQVIIPLLKGQIDESVYRAVSRKKNFNLKNFYKNFSI